MQILTVSVIKGGTGKTTTAAAIAQAGAKDGKRVLAIDLDPQANLTFSLGADQNAPGSYDLITGGYPAQLVQHTPQGVDTIAASPDLATLTTRAGSARHLQNALEPLKGGYDLIVIDTPPTMGEMTYNALQASTGLVIPLETDSNSLQGLFQIVDIAHQMQRSNPLLTIKGALLTRYDPRPKLNRFLRDTIADKAAEMGTPYLGEIRSGIAVREAQAMQQSLFDYAPGSKSAQDYKALYQILTKEG